MTIQFQKGRILALLIYGFFLATLTIFIFYLLKSLIYIHKTEYSKIVLEVQSYIGDATVELFADYFTEIRYKQAFILIPIVLIFSLSLLILLIAKRKNILEVSGQFVNKTESIVQSCISDLKRLSPSELSILIFILIALVISRIYLFLWIPINQDEVFSYLSFVRKGPGLILTFYTDVNNHVFSNLISYPFTYIFEDPIYIMRTPVILVTFLLWITVFFYCLKNYSFYTAIIALILIGLPFSTSFYSVIGRGYILLSFFTLASFFSYVKVTEQRDSVFYWIILIVSGILGAFTIQLFILPFLALSAHGILTAFRLKDFVFGKRVVQAGILVGIGVLYLYSPLIIVSGFESLTLSNYIVDYDDFSHFFKNILLVASNEGVNYILGVYSKGYLILPIIVLFMFSVYVKTKSYTRKIYFELGLLFFLCSFMLFIGKRTIMEIRMFTFVSYYFYFLLAITVGFYIEKLKPALYKRMILFSICIFYVALIPLTFRRKMADFLGTDYFSIYEKVDKGVQYVLEKNPDSLFVNYQYFLWGIQYQAIKEKRKLFIETINYNDKVNYDFVILRRPSDYSKLPDSSDYSQVNGILEGEIFESNP